MTAGRSALDAPAPDGVADLEAAGRYLEALDVLRSLDPAERGPGAEARLLDLRHRAFDQLDRSLGREPWPPASEDPFPGTTGIPEVDWRALDAPVLTGALVHHGCLLVRGLLEEDRAEQLRGTIDRAFEACRSAAEGAPVETTSPWFAPFLPGVGKTNTYDASNHIRTVDSPRAFDEVLRAFGERGIDRLIETYLGERPALSINKCELRKVQPAWGGPDFHQDGAFLGRDIRTVNVWVALTACGERAPGMALVPRRVQHILPTGQDGAMFNWTLSPATVANELGDPEIVRPVFGPGDALLFDHFFVHRTDNREAFTEDRYAIETWFFAPSAYPVPDPGKKQARPQVPLVL